MCTAVNLQRHTGVALCGVQWVYSTVAIVVASGPKLAGQLQCDVPPAGGDILSVPQVDLAAKIQHHSLRGAQYGDAGDGGPGLVMRNQPVFNQPVHTVGLHHSLLIDLVLFLRTGSWGGETISEKPSQRSSGLENVI